LSNDVKHGEIFRTLMRAGVPRRQEKQNLDPD
jgi:hypothetical protein